ncbi:tetraacyldisaccharide 4'-kinase [Aquitalea denitrificans]|uniref:tetraacyldisaccharide 4'-kinase n=1 Tax=Aquitalea denitrificans TaxID=519081 RepID=UPI001F0EC578|nr:tetraacyldisaccharide 4'-kinase [Aquitalea denitrificans]
MSRISQRIERHWYQPVWWLTALLAPLEGLFALLSTLRRLAYRHGVWRSHQLPVPVVVIGNINVGGVGKTPLTLSLLAELQACGVRVGVISRGYGGNHRQAMLVTADSSASVVGDEPLLLAASGVPVVVGRDRVAAGMHLLRLYPETQLILTDDGLQHYRLARTLELVVLDGRRGLGNGHLLPGGPLREPASRLASVDAVVVNGHGADLPLPADLPRFDMQLQCGMLQSLAQPERYCSPDDFAGQPVIALAGIGHPERFFQTLQQQGLTLQQCLHFPDHHVFSAADLPDGDSPVIVTSKDAVKLRGVIHDAAQRARLWVLPVAAQLTPDLAGWLLSRLKIRHGR